MIEWTLAGVRPSVLLCPDTEGPQEGGDRPAGTMGGLPRLPKGMAWPGEGLPLVATVDCAALPEGSVDLALPHDGHLLLFSDFDDFVDAVLVHVPAGTETVELEPAYTSGDGTAWDITVHEPRPLRALRVESFDHAQGPEALQEFVAAGEANEEAVTAFGEEIDEILGSFPPALLRLGGTSRYFQNTPEEDGLTHVVTAFGDPLGNPCHLALAGTPQDIAAGRYENLTYYLEA
ncbi:DUF1963 domain-containing protein [Streptomyces albidoflavus]